MVTLLKALGLLAHLPITFALDSNACGSVNVKFNFGTNTNIPQHLCVPTLGYDETSISLVWNKPDSYSTVVDYHIYMDGKKLGSASENNADNSVAAPYINQFYAKDTDNFHYKATYHNFKVTNLSPNTVYKFHVTSVDKFGKESEASDSIVQKTAPKITNVVDVATLGAVGDGKTLNTAIIQKAIDDCSGASTSAYGCKVLIPGKSAKSSSTGSIYVSGSLFLKSHMTLEIEEGATLLGSTNSSDYPMISNTSDTSRPYALLNTKQGSNNTYSDIRIIGKGTIDGNGWTKSSPDTTDELNNKLPNYAFGSDTTVQKLGILAKNQIQAAVDRLGGKANSSQINNFYINRRSSLVFLYKVRNLFMGNLRVQNSAFHGVQFSQCNNSVFANVNSQSFDINNGDGLNLISSSNTLVYNSFFNNGDDCINFGCGQGKAGKKLKTVQFTWILNNYFLHGHGGVAVGSHTAAWVQDMLAEDNVMHLTENGIRMKSTPPTGGGGRRFVFRDTAMREIGLQQEVTSGSANAFIVTLAYSKGTTGFEIANECAQFSNVNITRVSVDNKDPQIGRAVISVDGFSGADSNLPYNETFHENFIFDQVKLKNVKPTNISRLAVSSFTNVTITNWGNDSSPWNIEQPKMLTFENVHPMYGF